KRKLRYKIFFLLFGGVLFFYNRVVGAMGEVVVSVEYAEHKKGLNRFLVVLCKVYSLYKKGFGEATEALHGRTRVYFAGDEQTLLQNGNQTKPKHVPGTPY
ncbi:hypothetical protein ACVGWD_07235, partial [Enterobacter asburiae]